MQVNIKGLINRLDSLRERINDLLDNLDCVEELEQEDIEIETVRQYFQNDDTFNLSIALDILEQAEKLDNVLEIISKKNVCIATLKDSDSLEEYNDVICYHKVRSMTFEKPISLTQEEFDLLKRY